MAEIVNLSKRRKAKARDARESQAAANRIKYGRTKAEQQNDHRAEARRDRLHDSRKLGDENEPE